MKKLLIGLTLLASMSAFASQRIELTKESASLHKMRVTEFYTVMELLEKGFETGEVVENEVSKAGVTVEYSYKIVRVNENITCYKYSGMELGDALQRYFLGHDIVRDHCEILIDTSVN